MAFRQLIVVLRKELGLDQHAFASKLGISVRTLSHWECAHWLPPYKQRVHVVLRLSDAPPDYVLQIADALGVSVDPVVDKFLQPFHDALDEATTVSVPNLAPPARPPPPSVEQLRAAVDPIVLAAADALDARPNDLRALVAKVASACAALGASLDDVALAVKPTEKPKGSAPAA